MVILCALLNSLNCLKKELIQLCRACRSHAPLGGRSPGCRYGGNASLQRDAGLDKAELEVGENEFKG